MARVWRSRALFCDILQGKGAGEARMTRLLQKVVARPEDEMPSPRAVERPQTAGGLSLADNDKVASNRKLSQAIATWR
jgi:hypothetical protein